MAITTVLCTLMMVINDPCGFCPENITRGTIDLPITQLPSTESSVTELPITNTTDPTPSITKPDDTIEKRLFQLAIDSFKKLSPKLSSTNNSAVNALGSISFSILRDHIASGCKYVSELSDDIKWIHNNYPENRSDTGLKISNRIILPADLNFPCDIEGVGKTLNFGIVPHENQPQVIAFLKIKMKWSKFSKNYSSVMETFYPKSGENYTTDFVAMFGEYRPVDLQNTAAELITIRNKNPTNEISVTIVLPPSSEVDILEFAKTFTSVVSYNNWFNATAAKERKVYLPSIEAGSKKYKYKNDPLKKGTKLGFKFNMFGKSTVKILTPKNTKSTNGQADEQQGIIKVNRPFLFFIMWKKIIMSIGIKLQ